MGVLTLLFPDFEAAYTPLDLHHHQTFIEETKPKCRGACIEITKGRKLCTKWMLRTINATERGNCSGKEKNSQRMRH